MLHEELYGREAFISRVFGDLIKFKVFLESLVIGISRRFIVISMFHPFIIYRF